MANHLVRMILPALSNTFVGGRYNRDVLDAICSSTATEVQNTEWHCRASSKIIGHSNSKSEVLHTVVVFLLNLVMEHVYNYCYYYWRYIINIIIIINVVIYIYMWTDDLGWFNLQKKKVIFHSKLLKWPNGYTMSWVTELQPSRTTPQCRILLWFSISC